MIVNPLVFFDFETGGLDPKKNPALEIALLAISGNTGEELCRYEAIIKPSDLLLIYVPQAMQTHGLTHNEIQAGKTPPDVVGEIGNFFSEIKLKTSHNNYKKPILIGHNAAFDVGFLQQLFHHGKGDLKKLVDGTVDYFSNFTPQTIDTVQMAKLLWAEDALMPDFKLSTCAQKAGAVMNQAHRAMGDVIATKELFLLMLNKLRSEGKGVSQVSKVSVREGFSFQF